MKKATLGVFGGSEFQREREREQDYHFAKFAQLHTNNGYSKKYL